MAHSDPSDAARARRTTTERDMRATPPLSTEQAQQVAELVMLVVPAAASIGRQVWQLVTAQRQAAREHKAALAEEEQAATPEPATVPEIERSVLERMTTYFGELIYDYSGGAYGTKPPSMATLRHARKQAEREARGAARAAAGAEEPSRRGGVLVPLIMVGTVGAAGLVTLAVWQRVQLRAATRQAIHQVRSRLPMRGMTAVDANVSGLPADTHTSPVASHTATGDEADTLPHSAAMVRTHLPPQV